MSNVSLEVYWRRCKVNCKGSGLDIVTKVMYGYKNDLILLLVILNQMDDGLDELILVTSMNRSIVITVDSLGDDAELLLYAAIRESLLQDHWDDVLRETLEESIHDDQLRPNEDVKVQLESYTYGQKTDDHTTPKEEECTICYSNYQTNDKVCTLPQCNHRFHYDCVERWAKYKPECPLCRSKIPIIS